MALDVGTSPVVVACGVVAAVVLGTLVACRGGRAAVDGPVDPGAGALHAEPLASGVQSAIREPGVRIARTPEEFRALWEEHTKLQLPTPPAPEVDFHASMVVAVFLGGRPSGGYALEVEGVRVSGDGDIVVAAREVAPPPDSMTTQALTAPFELLVVERAPGEGHVLWGEPDGDRQ